VFALSRLGQGFRKEKDHFGDGKYKAWSGGEDM
jgi:hypothetical protein